MKREIVIAHLSDLHLGPIGRVPAHYGNLKRVLGAVNWHQTRRRLHRREVAEKLLLRAQEIGVDHVVISGDLCNLGLPQEHMAALKFLESAGPPDSTTVVPGNHDIYSSIGEDEGVGRWTAFMQSCKRGRGFLEDGARRMFPFVRVLGDGQLGAAIIGLNSAIETPPFRAHGRLGKSQLEGLQAVLRRTREAGLARVVVLHHPPLVELGKRHKELLDAAELENVLDREGAELVIYGHNHRIDMRSRPTNGGVTHVVGIGSSSAFKARGIEPVGSMMIYRIRNGGACFSVGHEIVTYTDPRIG